MSADPALFHRDGDLFVPTELTTGPWQADAMHGGPPSALLGYVIAGQREPGEHVARITVELERPVPLVPLRVHASRRQVSGRVAHIDLQVTAARQVVLSGRALLLRIKPLPEPAWTPDASPWPIPGPESKIVLEAFATGSAVPVTYHRDAVEHRMPDGRVFGAGPVTSWVKLLQPVIAGEPVSGLCSVLAAADFGSGISAVYTLESGTGLINSDLTVVLQREPVGAWIRLESETRVDDSGSALGLTMLADEAGDLGVATQSLLSIRTSG